MKNQLVSLTRFVLVGAFVASVWSCASVAMAAPPAPGVPEIDPASASSAMAVLAAGGLMLADRLGIRRK